MTLENATLRRPRRLSPGARIAVLSISSPSEQPRIELAAENLRRRGFDVSIAGNAFVRLRGYLADSDEVRLAALNEAIRSDRIDAICFTRGGYGAMRILEGIDYEAFRRNPRPVVGFSDLTALHQALATKTGVSTFHGPMLNLDFHDGLSDEVDRWMWDLLSGVAPRTFTFSEREVVSRGRARGILFGGCLSLTTALMGTPYDYWVDDGIWFWEDVAEPAYRIDRMLTQLKLAGRISRLRGIMIGKLRGCGDGDDDAVRAVVAEFFSGTGIPVVSQLPFGHFGDNLLLPVGQHAVLDADAGTVTIEQPVVS